MTNKYNNIILCIIIIVCIIVIISIGYHMKEHFNDIPELRVYQYKNEILPRLINDPDVKRYLVKYAKDSNRKYNVDISKRNIDISDIELAPKKINKLVEKVINLTKRYNKDKINLDKTILAKFNNSANIDDFNKKNVQLKNKIQVYRDNIELLKKGSAPNVIILKNNFTNKELSIQYVTKDNNDIELYFLVINNGCLNVESKGNYKIDSCSNSNYKQLFTLNKINNYLEYNNKISMGEQINSTLYVTKDDNIDYPFYMLSPYMIPGHCITYNKSELSVRPINNDVYQRFSLRTVSTACK